MGSMARAKVAAIPIPDGRIDPERVVESMMTSTPETRAASHGNACTSRSRSRRRTWRRPRWCPPSPCATSPARCSSTITRDRLITLALACISIGALFLVWYLGTKYRFEFYIRFKNVPTPAEVFNQLTQVGLSNKYLINIAISLRRILTGFFIAIAHRRAAGPADRQISARPRLLHAVRRDPAPDPRDRLGADVDHAVAEQRGRASSTSPSSARSSRSCSTPFTACSRWTACWSAPAAASAPTSASCSGT